MWVNVKRTLNWEIDSAPGELRDKKGRIETKLKDMAEIYHDSLDDKIVKIVQDMESFEESEEEETEALQSMFPRMTTEEFTFSPVEESDIEEILRNLPSKTSTGDDGISYVELKDALSP